MGILDPLIHAIANAVGKAAADTLFPRKESIDEEELTRQYNEGMRTFWEEIIQKRQLEVVRLEKMLEDDPSNEEAREELEKAYASIEYIETEVLVDYY